MGEFETKLIATKDHMVSVFPSFGSQQRNLGKAQR